MFKKGHQSGPKMIESLRLQMISKQTQRTLHARSQPASASSTSMQICRGTEAVKFYHIHKKCQLNFKRKISIFPKISEVKKTKKTSSARNQNKLCITKQPAKLQKCFSTTYKQAEKKAHQRKSSTSHQRLLNIPTFLQICGKYVSFT